jgi:DNA-binding MarR family transcriptional regulator
MAEPRSARVRDADYQLLLELRTRLRRFLRWSEERAAEVGLTSAQHQLLLAIRGSPEPSGPTIGEVAEHLLLRHHSTVELVDRAEAAGFVLRESDPNDHRIVRLRLTKKALLRLEQLTEQHLEEVRRLQSVLAPAFLGLDVQRPDEKRN